MNIQEAMAKMRQIWPRGSRRSLNIRLDVWDFDHEYSQPNAPLEITFSVHDGNNIFPAPTLEEAIRRCLIANTQPNGTIEDAEAVAKDVMEIGDVSTSSVSG